MPIWPVYRNTQGIFLSDKLAAAGEQVAFFDPSANGVRFVANSVITSRKMIETPTEDGRNGSTRALLAGWQAAVLPENEKMVIDTLTRYDKDTDKEVLKRQLVVTRRMIQPDTSIPVGRIDTAAWKQTEEIMLRQKLISQPVNVVKQLIAR